MVFWRKKKYDMPKVGRRPPPSKTPLLTHIGLPTLARPIWLCAPLWRLLLDPHFGLRVQGSPTEWSAREVKHFLKVRSPAA